MRPIAESWGTSRSCKANPVGKKLMHLKSHNAVCIILVTLQGVLIG